MDPAGVIRAGIHLSKVQCVNVLGVFVDLTFIVSLINQYMIRVIKGLLAVVPLVLAYAPPVLVVFIAASELNPQESKYDVMSMKMRVRVARYLTHR